MARRVSPKIAQRAGHAERRPTAGRTGQRRLSPARTDWLVWSLVLILWAIVGLVYADALGNGFVMDDRPHILDEYKSRQPWEWWAVLRDSWGNVQGRPLRTLSLNLDFSLFGLDPRPYHLANIVYHGVNTTLVFQVARRFLGGVRPAFIVALLFAVHPIQTEAVTYISGRKDLLATLFYLLAFLGFLRYCARAQRGPLALTVLAFFLALLSKESAMTFPAACLLYEVIYGMPAPDDRSPVGFARGAWQRVLAALSRHRLVYLALFGMAAASSAYALVIVKESEQRAYWGGSLGLSMLTMARAFLYYLKLLNLPTTLLPDYSFDTFPVSRSYADPWALLAVAGLMGILCALLWAWRFAPAVTFGGLWWFLTLLPVAQIIPHHIMMAERFLYLPSVGAVLAAGALLERSLGVERRRRLMYGGVAIAVVLLSGRTVVRNLDWKDEFTLMNKAVADSPRGVALRVALGASYQERGEDEAAEREYLEALKLNPGSAKAHAALASLFAQRGDPGRAEREFLEAIRLETNHGRLDLIRGDLAAFYERQGALGQAERLYLQVVASRPNDPLLRQNVAVFYHFTKRDPRRAEEEYRAALRLRPSEVEFYIGLAALYIETAQLSKAEELLRRGLAVNPAERRLQTLLQKVRNVQTGPEATGPPAEETTVGRVRER